MHRDTQTALDPQSLGTELFRSPQLQQAQCICLCAPSCEISGSSTVLLEVIGPVRSRKPQSFVGKQLIDQAIACGANGNSVRRQRGPARPNKWPTSTDPSTTPGKSY